MRNHYNKKRHKKNIKQSTHPFVSICTPTYNRRPFFKELIKCFNSQTYPKDRIEWIIIDDGTDKIEDVIKDVERVKYFKYDVKMTLGEKRNVMHTKCSGSIIVYMDDDDYYPPERVSHAVEKLLENPEVLCAGSSELYMYFNHLEKIYKFGPYGKNHATAGTFAFKKKLLSQTKYNNRSSLAEEKEFLKNYTIPFVQLDPLKTILVFSHDHNTFDKKKLLDNINPNFIKETDKTIDMFIPNKDTIKFYTNDINKLLEDYKPGRANMKSDVLLQMIEIEESRRKHAEKLLNTQSQQIILTDPCGNKRPLNMNEIIQLIQQQQQKIRNLEEHIKKNNLN